MAEENDKKESGQTFTFTPGKEGGEPSPSYLFEQRGETTQATVDDLRNYFDAKENDKLRAQFGSFDNYLGYMTEREQLIQENDEFLGDWANADAGLTESQQMLLEGEDLTITDPSQNVADITRQKGNAQSAGYENWLARNEELLNKYGASGSFETENGTTYKWNGSGYVKTAKQSDDLKNYAKLAMSLAVGGPLSSGVSGALGGGMLAGAAGGVASGAVGQLIMTGEINPEDLISNAITGAFSGIADMDFADMSEFERAVDNAVWDFSGALGVDYETANKILRTTASGVASGESLGDIAKGVVGQYGADVLMANVDLGTKDIEVPNLFKEGTSVISSEAIESVIGNLATGALKGDQDYYGMLRDFSREGGFDFLAPGRAGGLGVNVDVPEWLKDAAQGAEDFYQTNIRPGLLPIEQAARTAERTVRRAIPDLGLSTPDIDMPSLDLPSMSLGGFALGGGPGMLRDFDPFYSDVGYERVVVPELVLKPQGLFGGVA